MWGDVDQSPCVFGETWCDVGPQHRACARALPRLSATLPADVVQSAASRRELFNFLDRDGDAKVSKRELSSIAGCEEVGAPDPRTPSHHPSRARANRMCR